MVMEVLMSYKVSPWLQHSHFNSNWGEHGVNGFSPCIVAQGTLATCWSNLVLSQCRTVFGRLVSGRRIAVCDCWRDGQRACNVFGQNFGLAGAREKLLCTSASRT